MHVSKIRVVGPDIAVDTWQIPRKRDLIRTNGLDLLAVGSPTFEKLSYTDIFFYFALYFLQIRLSIRDLIWFLEAL